jgi:hypothetical protein
MKYLIWLGVAVALTHTAAAQDEAGARADTDRGPYVGVSLGAFSYEHENAAFGILVDDTTPAFRLIGGYRLSEHFALEGGWGETSDLEDGTAFSNVTIDLSGKYEVLTIRALGILPLGDTVSFYGGLGYYKAELDASVTMNNLVGTYDVEDRTDGATIVGGVELDLERIKIRAEIEKFDNDASDAWDASVGVVFRF